MGRDNDARLAASFNRTSRALNVITVALVILVSPLSVAFSLPLGIAPQSWLSTWQSYVFVFVVLATVIALAGFAAASGCRVRAERIRRSIRNG